MPKSKERVAMEELARQLAKLVPDGEGVDIGRYQGKVKIEWYTDLQRAPDETFTYLPTDALPATARALDHACKVVGAKPLDMAEPLKLPDTFMQTEDKVDWHRVERFLVTLSPKDLRDYVRLWGPPLVKLAKRIGRGREQEEDYASDALETLIEEYGVAQA